MKPEGVGSTWHLFLVCFLAVGCATLGKRQAREFEVGLEVDFGPANRPTLQRVVQVKRGTTPELLLAQVYTVQKGAVCCDSRETAAIDGVAADPATNRWWTVSVNGSKKVSPYKTRLKSGDQVRWEYRQSDQ